MDVLHNFTGEKKIKNKLSKDISFNHMYKNSDKLGGKIHSKLPKMTMPKMTMPKIAYAAPHYKSNVQDFHFSNMIRRDRNSRNETSSSIGPAHITDSMSSIISTAQGPANPNLTASAKSSEKGIYGTSFKNLQVTALTDTQAKALLPTVSAQLASGLTPDVVTLKQLEPYMKLGATQIKPIDIAATGLMSNRLTKGTGFSGPGDPTYQTTTYGPIHDLGLTQPMYNYFQPGLSLNSGTTMLPTTRQAGNTANVTPITNQATMTPIVPVSNIQSNVAAAIGTPSTGFSSGGGTGGGGGGGRASTSTKTTTPAKTTPAPAPAPTKAISVPSSEKFLSNPSGNAASNIGAIEKAAGSGSTSKSPSAPLTFAPAPAPQNIVQKAVNVATNIWKAVTGKK
jgi:hypothetical protein